MLKDGYYYPSDEDRAVFKRIIAAVRLNPDWFAQTAAALDRDYSTQAIRNRRAAELREHRSIPNHIKRSRAYERKHCRHEALSQQLGFTVTPLKVIPSPPNRLKGADGKPQQPDIELRKRFAHAVQDAFEEELDLDVHELQAGLDIAARRVLLAWLQRDANRCTVQKITEFQELRDKRTEDGIGPLWIPDDAELQNWDKSRFIRQDGGIERDAPTWIKKAREAIDFLESQADSTGLSFSKGNNSTNADASTPPRSNLSDRSTAPPEMLEPAVAELLNRIPETWETYNPDDLTETQSQALFLLVAAGMVEKRERMRMRFADHPVSAEATITATGEYGGVEALKSLFANLWTDWKDAFQSWQQSEAASDLPAYCERLEPSEWRLTDQGVIARNDLDAPDDSHMPAEARRQGVFDFVLKRGFFKGRPPQRGVGALVKMNKAKADTAPAGVNIGNWSEGGDAFAQAFGPMLASIFKTMQGTQPKPPDTQERIGKGDEIPEGAGSGGQTASPKAKQSTERGEGQAKLIAALTKYHKYADGSALNCSPVGNNELARLAKVSDSTASLFFKKQFKGHAKYRAMCSNTNSLITALKLLNQEFAPHALYGAKPPGEKEREDEYED